MIYADFENGNKNRNYGDGMFWLLVADPACIEIKDENGDTIYKKGEQNK